jgi:hypothetical protein
MTSARPSPTMEGQGHPAVEAWRRLQPGRVLGEVHVETLQKRTKGRVFRLRAAGPDGEDVVAKWTTRERVLRESLAYEEVLPFLPVSCVRHYGTVEDESGWWLFVASAGREKYSAANGEHRSMAGRWLGVLHTSAHLQPPRARLPDRSPAYYLRELRVGSDEVADRLDNPALTPDDVFLLKEMLTQCEVVASHWRKIERLCKVTPPTFVHGDFAPKNMRVNRDGERASLRPFDWASAGWGTPAPDLPQLDATPSRYWSTPDLDAYRATVSRSWPRLTRRDLIGLAVVGKIFRSLVCLRLEATGLTTDWPERGMSNMRFYHADLRDALGVAGWSR